MEKEVLISFIIPVYNIPTQMVCECIDSILALSLRQYEREIIVVDDGSDHYATPLLGELGNRADALTYVRQQNAGVSAARNRGLQLARGRFIQFIDGDDMLIKAPYEHVLDIVRYGKADVVTFDFAHQPTASALYDDAQPASGIEVLSNSNIHGAVWAYTFKRSILGALRFTQGVAYGEDEEFTPQLLLKSEQVVRSNAQAYYYRQRDTSAVNSLSMRSRLSRLNDTKHVICRLHAIAATLSTAEQTAMRRRIAQLTMDYIYNVITLTESRHYLDRQLKELTAKGLFPLPNHNYTAKYAWFRCMTNSDIGLKILFATLPLMNRER